MTDKPQPSSLDASRSLSPTCPNCGGSDPHALLIHPGGKCLHIWHQLCPQKPVSPVPVSPSGQRCGVLCGKCGTAAEMHVCPNGAYHFLRNEFTETWPPVKPNQGNKSPGTDRPADPSPVSSGLRVERERTCKRCGLELAWQSGYEQWTHKRSGLPFCNLSADPSLQVSPELKLLRVIQKFLYGYQLSEPLGGYRAWNEGISSACAQLFDPQENGEVLKALDEYRESRVTAPVGQPDDPEWKRLRLTAWENRALKAESALKDLTEMVEFGEQHHPKDFWRFIFGEPGSGFRHAAYRAAVNVLHEQIFNPAALASPPQIAQPEPRIHALESAIANFQERRGKHEGDHDSAHTACSKCELAYIEAEQELDKAVER